LVLGDDAFVCGPTAAWLYGIDVQDRRSELVWVGFHARRRGRQRPGCYVREITVDQDDLIWWSDVPVTSPVRTTFDCLRWLSPVEGVVVADALVHRGLVRVDDLSTYAKAHRGLRNVTRVDRALELIEPLAESPMETRLRLLLMSAGLPRPVAQHVVQDEVGRFVARLDLAYPAERVAVEYDGAFHWNQRRDDDRRRDRIRTLGWTVLVFSAEDYYQQPEALTKMVRAALASRG
jgi:very-short-patch-repair endonuclease